MRERVKKLTIIGARIEADDVVRIDGIFCRVCTCTRRYPCSLWC